MESKIDSISALPPLTIVNVASASGTKTDIVDIAGGQSRHHHTVGFALF